VNRPPVPEGAVTALPPAPAAQAVRPAARAVPETPAEPDAAARAAVSGTVEADPESPVASAEHAAGAEVLTAPVQPGSPLAGLLPLDLDGLRRSADAFFQRLADFGDEWDGLRLSAHMGPWLAVAVAVACELARRRKQGALESLPGSGLAGWDEP
jgi:hypothetical protein